MKKILLLTLCALLWMNLYGGSRNVQQARLLAPKPSALRLCHTALQPNGQPAFYVFNRGEEEGFVLVSAESRTHTILGYSDQGHWDEKDLPENVRVWLDNYCHAISYAASQEEYTPAEEPTRIYTPVPPICTTEWGQRDPYNRKCPTVNGSTCVTGCVATAAAQLMKTYGYPESGTGTNSYGWVRSTGDTVTMSEDFTTCHFDWAHMLDTYPDTATEEQINAVANLMYYCGIACNMQYRTGTSSATTATMVRAFAKHFHYDKGIRSLMYDYMGEADIIDSIAADLYQGHPVLINARTILDVGHAFLCDGIDSDGLLHINWGWFGKSNGYFRLSAFNPKEQGTGGATMYGNYTENIRIYTHIQPDKNNPYAYSFTCENVLLDTTCYARQDTIVFYIDTFNNRSIGKWEGHFAVRIYKDDQLYSTYEDTIHSFSLSSGYYFHHRQCYANLSALPQGEYELLLTAIANDQPGLYEPIMRKWTGGWRCGARVTKDSVFLSCPEVIVPERQGVPAPDDFTYANLRAYYYPSSSNATQHHWKLQLATASFYSSKTNSDQALLLFHVYSHSPESIIGDYPSDAQQTFRCYSSGYYLGNAQTSVLVETTKGACSLTYDDTDNVYIVRYHLRVKGKDYEDEARIGLSNIRAYYGEDYGTHSKSERITLTHLPMAIDTPIGTPTQEVRKVLSNGQLLIIRNGIRYTMQGIRVND